MEPRADEVKRVTPSEARSRLLQSLVVETKPQAKESERVELTEARADFVQSILREG